MTWLLCGLLGSHRWAWSQDRVNVLAKTSRAVDTVDGKNDGEEERFVSLEFCERCGMVRWR